MPSIIKNKRKVVTQKDVDTANARLDARMREIFLEDREDEHSDPHAVVSKIQQIETVLLTHLMEKVDGSPWRFQGFDIKPNREALALWPITAKLLFTHDDLVGYDAALIWGESGSETAFAWLEQVGFPIADIELEMN